jgi:hypothetical protein
MVIPAVEAGLQRGTLGAGAEIIENGKITKPCPKK